ncbi:MAG TPA: LuxR C-terminal-related transcriptional regulator [Gaiellaceae bacterium]|nr:LuxR C-terminal-related transcriptional regulator [Gaiellaceae bacterium]
METISPALSPALAHIIERPRLIARLEEGGGSRVSVFAAPAGYGKTTLARQWSERQTGQVVWYRTTRASGDVALLAVQFDELLASLGPELPREPGKVASIASVNPSPKPLGRALVRTFESLGDDILIIVDEWEAAETPESDELLSMLVDGLPNVRWVITTRDRPEWFAPKLEVYGEGLEIGVDELTMTDEEAAQVLSAAGAVAGRARVMRTAGGWPAVLGLAAMSGEVDFTATTLMSHKLYEFLASELVAAATPETQEALTLLAIASVVNLERAKQLLGDAADATLSEASARGLLAITERSALFFHPLLREMLIRGFASAGEKVRGQLMSRCRRLLEFRLWDEALSVGELSLDPEFIAEAIAVALDEVLAAGRTSSLARWVGSARSAKADGALIDYAEAELRLRQGEFDGALALAAHAAKALKDDLAARAHLVAARAAHLGSRAEARDTHLEHARALAATPQTDGDLRWLRFAASVEDELPEAEGLFEELESFDRGSFDHELRIATARLHLGLMRGELSAQLQRVEPAVTLLQKATDPYAATALLNVYADVLTVAGRFDDALSTAERELAIADEYALEFVVGYAEINRARALTGLRRFGDARRSIAKVERRLRNARNAYLQCQRAIYLAALHISQGELSRAADVLSGGTDPDVGRSLEAERRAVHALTLVALGKSDEAAKQSKSARVLSQGVEMQGHLAAAAAVLGAQKNDRAAVLAACDEILELGARSSLVLGWRACVDVARIVLSSNRHRELVIPLLLNANDTAIAKRVGVPVPRDAQPRRGLSAREHEVCELVAQGLTNEEIAKLLFISLSTTKVHVKHIFEKLGVQSRMEAARLWDQGVA